MPRLQIKLVTSFIPVEITVYDKGSKVPKMEKVGKITVDQLRAQLRSLSPKRNLQSSDTGSRLERAVAPTM
ncbi:hypothetical protein SAY87_032001 [Trapa incisa]|uniref:Uncharacterized protein n=1 Tax=Trapa incisa TaxID=236973 RepID=A0AAN7QLL9_9MYRT|nr:hypothetical protein SAY87_032001 [Trapa incisa]